MMIIMNRVNELSNHRLEQYIQSLEQDIREIKSIQYTGYDSISPKVTRSQNTFDAVSDSDGLGGYFIDKIVTFTAINQGDVYASIVPKFFDFFDNEVNQSFFNSIHVQKDRGLAPDLPGSYQSKIRITADAINAFKVKLYVLATDMGSFVIT